MRHRKSFFFPSSKFGQVPVSDWINQPSAWEALFDILNEAHALNWGYVPNPAGGFLAAWWSCGEPSDCRELYLQIEQGPLCFKIRTQTGSIAVRAALRNRWHERMMEAAWQVGVMGVRRPGRFGNGSTMTVAIVPPEEWLRTDATGMLDLAATLVSLARFDRVAQAAIDR